MVRVTNVSEYPTQSIQLSLGSYFYLSKNLNIVSHSRYDDTTRRRYTLTQFFFGFLGTVAVFLAPVQLFWNTPAGMPMTVKQMPRRNDPHVYYTFESANK